MDGLLDVVDLPDRMLGGRLLEDAELRGDPSHRVSGIKRPAMEATDVTALLVAWSKGDEAAGTPLMDAVYDQLRQLARAKREARESQPAKMC